MADHLLDVLSWSTSMVQWSGAYGRPKGNNIANSQIQESLCSSSAQYPASLGGRIMLRLVVGWMVSKTAAWSDLSESSHNTFISPNWAEMSMGSLARTRLVIEGRAFSFFQVGDSEGLRHVMLLSPIHSVKVLAHEEGVCPERDHRGE